MELRRGVRHERRRYDTSPRGVQYHPTERHNARYDARSRSGSGCGPPKRKARARVVGEVLLHPEEDTELATNLGECENKAEV